MGYDLEIDYFLNCIATGTKPQTVTLQDAVNSVRIVEAEIESLVCESRLFDCPGAYSVCDPGRVRRSIVLA